jgi:chromosome segregation ATPase
MTRINVALVALLAAVGAWGCSRSTDTIAQKAKELEQRTTRLQSELSQSSARINELEQRLAQEQSLARSAQRDLETLNVRFKLRTDERDAVQQQFDSLIKTLETALGQVKAARAATTIEQLPAPRETSTVKVSITGG